MVTCWHIGDLSKVGMVPAACCAVIPDDDIVMSKHVGVF